MLRTRTSLLGRDDFIDLYGGIYEKSRWVAERAFDEADRDQLDTVEALSDAMKQVVESANQIEQLDLIKAHPDLAGKAAIAGELTAESTAEQKGAGLDRLTPDQFQKFQALNTNYTERFGFPFIIAVKGHTADSILEAFVVRLQNSVDEERKTALEQIHRIASFRLADLGEPET